MAALDNWFKAIDVTPDYNTMVFVPGNGGSQFEFNFTGGYLNRSDIKAYKVKDGTTQTVELTLDFVSDNMVLTSEPVPVGWTCVLYRDTPKTVPLISFVDGAMITARNLDRNAKQSVFAVAELIDRFQATNVVADKAVDIANEAKRIAGQAVNTANSAKVEVADVRAHALRAADKPIDALPNREQRRDSILGFDSADRPVMLPADWESNTGLALVLADNNDPGRGASRVGWEGSDVGTLLNGLRGIQVERVLGNRIGFANWPQGKMCEHNGKIFMGFNFGRMHGGLSLHAYVTSTEDGRNFSKPSLVAAPTPTEEATWWGLVSLGTKMVGTVRFRYGGGGETPPMRNVIYESNLAGSGWTPVREIEYKTPAGNDISMMQGGIVLSDGKIAFQYQDGAGYGGVVVVDPENNYDYRIVEMLNPENNSVDGLGKAAIQVELNLLRRQDTDQVLIVSRTQRNDIAKPKIWVANGDFTSITGPVETDIPVNVNPVTPVFSTDFKNVLFFYSERYNRANKKAGLFVASVPLNDAFSLSWTNVKHTYLMQLSGGPTSKGGIAGVQHAVRSGDKIYVGVATKANNSDEGSDILFVTMDFSTAKPAVSPSTGSLKGATPNLDVELALEGMGDYAPRVRMGGKSLISYTGSEFAYGYNNGNLGYDSWSVYTGHTRPAILIEASTGNVESQRGRTLFQQRPTFTRPAEFLDLATFSGDMFLQAGKTLHLGDTSRIRVGGSPSDLGGSFLYYDGTTKELQLGTPTVASGYTMKFMSAVAQGYIFSRAASGGGAAVNVTLEDSDGKQTTLTAGGGYGTLRVSNRFGEECLRIAENKSVQFSSAVAFGSYLVSELAGIAAIAGMQVYCRNARKVGERTADPKLPGTGAPVYFDGSNWLFVSTDTPVE